MGKAGKRRSFLGLILAITMILILVYSGTARGQIAPLDELKKKSSIISAEERLVMENLFNLVQAAEELGRQEERIIRETAVVHGDFMNLSDQIAAESAAYARKKDILKLILQSYQRRGPGSYLEILLNSDSMTAFIRRVNTLRDLAHNTEVFLRTMDASKEKLTLEKAKAAEKMRQLQAKQQQLKFARAATKQKQGEKEKYLQSLREKNDQYRAELARIQAEWDQLKLVFSGMIQEISRIIAAGYLEKALPPEAMKLSFSLQGVKGTIDQQSFNQIIDSYASLPGMVVSFQPDALVIALPDKDIILNGTLLVLNQHSLKFVTKTASFHGLPLDEASIAELFQGSQLIFDFKPMIGDFVLGAVEIEAGSIALELRRDSRRH